jgi:hypothetical protein
MFGEPSNAAPFPIGDAMAMNAQKTIWPSVSRLTLCGGGRRLPVHARSTAGPGKHAATLRG